MHDIGCFVISNMIYRSEIFTADKCVSMIYKGIRYSVGDSVKLRNDPGIGSAENVECIVYL